MVCLCFYLEMVFNKGTRQLKNGLIELTTGIGVFFHYQRLNSLLLFRVINVLE